MRQRSPAEVRRQKVGELGLDPERFDLTSTEAIAGALRRASGFLCPCTASSLVRAVVEPLRGLVEDMSIVKATVKDTLEAMVSHGDVLEYREFNVEPGQESTLLYAAPAAFVPRDSGRQMLLGILGDQGSLLPQGLMTRIEYVGHTRHLTPVDGEDLPEQLTAHGLQQRRLRQWLKTPRFDRPAQLLAKYNTHLDSASRSGDVPGLRLLDPETPVRYYRGRWIKPHKQSGRFLGRRDQAYGAQLWSYVQVRDGHPEALVDLPLPKSRWRGCDEAWHLQMAIDAHRGNPQEFEIRVGPEDTRVIAFFSPVPMWALRRWEAIGERLATNGCLFAYRIAKDDLPQETRFLREALWLNELIAGE